MDNIQELYHLFPEIEDQIVVEKKVGQGTFSFVYLGYFKKNNEEKVALKYIIPTSAPTRTKQEIECLLNFGGKDNVVGVLAVLRNKSHILVLMPYVEHISFHDSFIYWDIEEVKNYIKNLLIALNRVHQSGIIHRDIKPSNFLYDRHKKKYALVDFGLAQSYEKSSDYIFTYEKGSNKKTATSLVQNENSSLRKNFISITNSSSRKSTSSHLVQTQPKNQSNNQMQSSNSKNDPNSMPHSSHQAKELIKAEKFQISNSQSYESNLSSMLATPTKLANTPSKNLAINSTNLTNSPKPSTPNFQKYYSFQKPSYSVNDYKCTCFNMQFVCETCTSRSSKWAPRSGTAGFRAPEVLFRSTDQTPSVDIWSAGVIFLSILTGRYPFFKAADDNMAMMQLISLFGFDNVRKTALKHGESLICSHDKKQLDLKETCKILRKNSVKGIITSKSRQSIENNNESIGASQKSTIVEEFPDSAYDLLKKLLELDCDKRVSAEVLLNHPFLIT